MSDEHARRRLAALIVEALEVGTVKREWDVLNDLFAAFGTAAPPLAGPRRLKTSRSEAARRLSEAAPSSAALLNELIRCGGRFVAMLDEVYTRLSRHAATTAGTSDTFRLRRSNVAEDGLTLSPAFVEQVRQLAERLVAVQLSRVDERAIADFVGPDNGVFYGRWPLHGPDPRRLADAVLHLNWVAADEMSGRDPRVGAAVAAAERLVTAAERLVADYMEHLDLLDDLEPGAVKARLFANAVRDAPFANELRLYRTERVVGTLAGPPLTTGLEETSIVGLDRELQPVLRPLDAYWYGTGVGALAGFAAMWRSGRWAAREAEQLRSRLGDPAERAAWLGWVAEAADDAARWLSEDVAFPLSAATVPRLIEAVIEYLNLPLWKQRSLLYEVWVLCATLDGAEQAGWTTELSGLTAAGGVWTLSVGRSPHPVARLHRGEPPVTLDVWREPERTTGAGLVTPDLTVATTGQLARDLLVVEAKDRHAMAPGQRAPLRRKGRQVRVTDTALWVAHRYAATLGPNATWVCNHCDFQNDPNPTTNHGDPWTQVHLASRFRPGSVPEAFAASVGLALQRPGE